MKNFSIKSFLLGILLSTALFALGSFLFYQSYDRAHIPLKVSGPDGSYGYELQSPIMTPLLLGFEKNGKEVTYRNPKQLPTLLVKKDGVVDLYTLSKDGLEDVTGDK